MRTVVVGAVGLTSFVYRKKQTAKICSLVLRIGLMAFRYFMSNTILRVVVGLAPSVIPYFLGL